MTHQCVAGQGDEGINRRSPDLEVVLAETFGRLADSKIP